jgi:uncharacterized protein YlzI (FlbEa/FlbD family)
VIKLTLQADERTILVRPSAVDIVLHSGKRGTVVIAAGKEYTVAESVEEVFSAVTRGEGGAEVTSDETGAVVDRLGVRIGKGRPAPAPDAPTRLNGSRG